MDTESTGTIILGAAIVLIALVIVWITRPIMNRLPAAPVVQYVPPPGSVIDHGILARADRRTLTAGLVALAVSGKIRILAPQGANGPVAIEAALGSSLSPDERFFLQVFRPQRMTKRQQRRYLRALAELGIQVATVEEAPDISFLKGPAAFKRRRRREIARLLESTRERLFEEGLAKKRPVRIHLYVLSLLFLGTLVLGLILLIGAFANGAWVSALVIVATLVSLFCVLLLAPPPLLRFTPRGQEVRRHLAGLRDYIRLGEQDRLRFLQSPQGALRTPAGALTPGGQALGLRPQPTAGDAVAQAGIDRYLLIERLLPYAVLFRQEKQWQQELQGLGDIDVSRNLEALETTVEGVMVVAETLVVIGQAVRFVGSIFALFGRLD